MLGWILLGAVAIGAAILFVVQAQAGGSRQQIAAVTLAGAGVSLVAFFTLPWITVDGGLDLIGTLAGSLIPADLMRQLESTGVIQELRRMIAEQTLITGWSLAAEIPMASAWFQFSLFTIPASGIIALAVGAMTFAENPAAKPAGLFLLVLSVISAGILFLMLRRIRTLGIDPGMFMPLLDLLQIHLGPGVWFSFVGLAICGGSGGMLAQMPAKTKKGVGMDRRRLKKR